MPEDTAGSGMARVIITTDEPARVSESSQTATYVRGRRAYGTQDTLLCETTPCAITMTYGDHALALTSRSDAARSSGVILHVHDSTVVLNHTLGTVDVPVTRAVGAALVVVGLLVAATAGAIGAAEKNSDANADLGGLGIAAGAGIGALGVGGLLMLASPTVERAGASTEWSPPKSAAIGTSLAFKF